MTIFGSGAFPSTMATYPGSPDGYSRQDWYYPNLLRPDRNLGEILHPLFEVLTRLDAARENFERFGGGVVQLQELTAILNEHIIFRNEYGSRQRCMLIELKKLRSIVSELSGYTVHLEVRSLHHGFPVYYCCRTRHDIYAEYGLIVEDLYMSPSYPQEDERFVQLRINGREEHWLRLSHFREPVAEMLENGEQNIVDQHIYAAGRWVLSAAWNESQRPSLRIAGSLGIDTFFQAVEVTHLALTSDPCELRVHVDDNLLRFFDSIYVHAPIHSYLLTLPLMSGEHIDRIWREALVLYKALALEYTRFLKIEVVWGVKKSRTPLWKVVFGNYSRMDLIGDILRKDDGVLEASAKLEVAAADITARLLI